VLQTQQPLIVSEQSQLARWPRFQERMEPFGISVSAQRITSNVTPRYSAGRSRQPRCARCPRRALPPEPAPPVVAALRVEVRDQGVLQ
jgi:hypothetical protein